MTAYYNEFDPKTAAWLRQLVKNGDIADGVVDERDVRDVEPKDLDGFTQCHFFAGIGVWSYALRRAGWSDDRPVWTASLPCQPFSAAGKQKGKEDERHLLPHYIKLVRQCKPDVQFGEQVPGAVRHGWLDDLYDEMERENYAVGATVLTAAGAGLPHIRQRLYWVAHSNRMGDTKLPGLERHAWDGNNSHKQKWQHKEQTGSAAETGVCSGIDWLYCSEKRKYRPIKPGIKPVVDGAAKGVVHCCDSIITPDDSGEALKQRIEGYGNAVVAPVAEKFISAYMEVVVGH